MAVCFGAGLLALRVLRASAKEPVGWGGPWRELMFDLVGAAVAGTAAGVLTGLFLGRGPFSQAGILYLLAAQVYLLALAACLSSWRLPLGELLALLLFVPTFPLQLLVHAGVLVTPGDVGLLLLPPASFMVDLPAWAADTWSRGGWNPLAWPRGLAGPGFGTGALVWAVHVGLLLGLAGWGRARQRHRQPLPGIPAMPQSGK